MKRSELFSIIALFIVGGCASHNTPANNQPSSHQGNGLSCKVDPLANQTCNQPCSNEHQCDIFGDQGNPTDCFQSLGTCQVLCNLVGASAADHTAYCMSLGAGFLCHSIGDCAPACTSSSDCLQLGIGN